MSNPITGKQLEDIIEAALLVSGQPLNMHALQRLFSDDERPANAEIKEALKNISDRYQDGAIFLKEVGNGHRFQTKPELSPWLARLWEERSPRYSRAFLETLAIIAYKQPITRGEIEEIRGVTVSSNIMKTLLEREWVRVLGYREVPGKPAIYGTTKNFLDYFNLKALSELPPLMEFKNLATQEAQLQVQLQIDQLGPSDSEVIPAENRVTESEEDDNVIDIHSNQATSADDADSAEGAEDDDELAAG